MKRLTTILLTLLLVFPLFAQRPKVGLVLCGGGAKGAGHIGVIKVLEEYGIPIDLVVGTSMGAIIGGMYSIGYTGQELEDLMLSQDWNLIMTGNVGRNQLFYDTKTVDDKLVFTVPFKINADNTLSPENTDYWRPENSGRYLPTSVYSGQNIFTLLSDCTAGYHNYTDFNDLPIPFSCVGVDIVNAEEVEFHDGILPLAIRASMAIPGVFAPVRIGNKLFIDGGFRNNYPVDVARRMGADIVIGVKLGYNDSTYVDYDNPLALAESVLSVTTTYKTEAAIEDTDILIAPTVGEYGVMSFNTEALRNLINYGEEATREMSDVLLDLKKSLGNPPVKHSPSKVIKDSLILADVVYNGVSSKEAKVLEKVAEIKTGERISKDDISKAVERYYATNAYSSVSYILENENEPFNLVVNFVKKMSNQVGVGVRADTEEVISALFDLRFNHTALYGSKFALNARISQNYAVNATYTYRTKYAFEVNVNASLRNYSARLSENRWNSNLTFLQHTAGLDISTSNFRNFIFKVGAEVDYFKYNHASVNYDRYIPETYDTDLTRNGFFNVGAKFGFDNLDDIYFAKRGTLFEVGYTNYFDLQTINSLFADVSIRLEHNISIGKRATTTFIPFFKGRALIGENIPMIYMNILGGNEDGRYSESQMSVFGLNAPYAFDKFVMALGLDLRQQIAEKHYISMGGNIVKWENEFETAVASKGFWGVRFRYAYQLRFFPIAANVQWSTYTKKAGFYLSVGYWF
ncbi:MAG: patatin-like phospholipase family protein [Bacteroidales bacterium]|nr:patatin-like phospholipase family protein [Bacteroidales bacterium]